MRIIGELGYSSSENSMLKCPGTIGSTLCLQLELLVDERKMYVNGLLFFIVIIIIIIIIIVVVIKAGNSCYYSVQTLLSSRLLSKINTFKYHVFAPMGRFQLESIYLYFPPSSQLLHLFSVL